MRELAKAKHPNADGRLIEDYATEMLYKANEEEKWFRLTKKK